MTEAQSYEEYLYMLDDYTWSKLLEGVCCSTLNCIEHDKVCLDEFFVQCICMSNIWMLNRGMKLCEKYEHHIGEIEYP